MARYGMVIDTFRCVGCHSCSVACKSMNNLPVGIWWNRVMTKGGKFMDCPEGEYPSSLKMMFIPVSCQHCENPACVKVCPVGATYKDPETGVTRQDYDKCIGCRMCIAACPYTGVRSFNWEEPKYDVDFQMGDIEAPLHQKHAVEKCTFCYQRLSLGKEPACMVLCPGRARFWGDLDDPDSVPNQKLQGRQYFQLLPEQGTKPNAYYLV